MGGVLGRSEQHRRTRTQLSARADLAILIARSRAGLPIPAIYRPIIDRRGTDRSASTPPSRTSPLDRSVLMTRTSVHRRLAMQTCRLGALPQALGLGNLEGAPGLLAPPRPRPDTLAPQISHATMTRRLPQCRYCAIDVSRSITPTTSALRTQRPLTPLATTDTPTNAHLPIRSRSLSRAATREHGLFLGPGPLRLAPETRRIPLAHARLPLRDAWRR